MAPLEATSRMSPSPATLDAKLSQAWRREQGFHHLRGLAHIVVWIIGLIHLDLLLDWLPARLDWFVLPGWARFGLLLLNLAVLAWVVYRYWIRDLSRYDPVRAALQVERLHPHLNSLLVSYVQLNGYAPGPVHGSPRMILAARGQATEAAGPLDFGGIVDFRRLRPLLAAAASALLLFAIGLSFFGGYYRVLFIRLIDPRSTLAYPTRTQIGEHTKDLSVPQGRPFHLWVEVSDVIPDEGTLFVKYDTRWERVALVPEEMTGEGSQKIRRFSHQAPKAVQSFRYYFRTGDARTEEYQVTVIPPPRIVSPLVRLTYPAYTGLQPSEEEALNLDVPEGTAIEWRLGLDQALDAAQMALDNGTTLSLKIDPENPQLAVLNQTAEESFAYQFHWKSRGFGDYADHVRYSVRVRPDEGPRVEVLKPRRPQEKGLVAKTINLLFQATDDYGLGKAWVVYRHNDGDEQRIELEPLGDKQTRFAYPWKPSAKHTPDLKEGDLIEYVVEVSDNREGKAGPNRTRSKPMQLRVVSRAEYDEYRAQMEKLGFQDVTEVQVDETKSGEIVKTLKEAKP